MKKLGLYEIHALDTEWSLEIEYDETNAALTEVINNIKDDFDAISSGKTKDGKPIELFTYINDINNLIGMYLNLYDDKVIKAIWTRLN